MEVLIAVFAFMLFLTITTARLFRPRHGPMRVVLLPQAEPQTEAYYGQHYDLPGQHSERPQIYVCVSGVCSPTRQYQATGRYIHSTAEERDDFDRAQTRAAYQLTGAEMPSEWEEIAQIENGQVIDAEFEPVKETLWSAHNR